MSRYDNIVDQALDVSEKHREDKRTEDELRDLFSRFRLDIEDDVLLSLVRYVSLTQYRQSDADFKLFGPGNVSGV